MKQQKNNLPDYLDIIYDNRNKQYGSYLIRRQNDKRLYQSLGIMILLCTAVLLTGMIPDKKTVINRDTVVYDTMVITLIPKENIKPPIEKPQPKPEPPSNKPTIKNTPPVIVKDTEPADVLPNVDSLQGKESGPVNSAGTPDGTVIATTKESGKGTEPVIPTPSEPKTYVQQMPEFNGNIRSYLSKHIRYPAMAKENGIEGRVIIRFVVNEDGSVSNVEILRGAGGGLNEEALRVVNGMPAWKPGRQNDVPVKVYFTLPISFSLK